MAVSSKNTSDLKRDQARAQNQRPENHAIRHQLRRHRKEEEARLLAAGILNGSVAQGNEQSLEEEPPTQEDSVYGLLCVSNSAERNAGSLELGNKKHSALDVGM